MSNSSLYAYHSAPWHGLCFDFHWSLAYSKNTCKSGAYVLNDYEGKLCGEHAAKLVKMEPVQRMRFLMAVHTRDGLGNIR